MMIMVPESVKTRGVHFAFLFGPPKVLTREEASQVHGNVCDELKLEDIAFKYTPVSESDPTQKSLSKGFSVVLERSEGRGGFRATIEGRGAQAPMKLLMEMRWPPSPAHVRDYFDMTSETVFATIEGKLQKVMAEVRLRVECAARGGEALRFIQEHLIRLTGKRADVLGDAIAFASVGLEVAPAEATRDSLAHPRRQIKVEVLREDPRSLYLELMSQWTQLPVGKGEVDLGSVRPIDRKPSEYLSEAETFLTDWANTLADIDGET